MKRIIVIIAIVFCIGVAQAMPPRPSEQSTNNGAHKVGDPEHTPGPVGTATVLLLSLGAGAVAYKVRRNKKEESLS